MWNLCSGRHPQVPHSWIPPSWGGKKQLLFPLSMHTTQAAPWAAPQTHPLFHGLRKPRTWISLALALFRPAASSRAGMGQLLCSRAGSCRSPLFWKSKGSPRQNHVSAVCKGTQLPPQSELVAKSQPSADLKTAEAALLKVFEVVAEQP